MAFFSPSSQCRGRLKGRRGRLVGFEGLSLIHNANSVVKQVPETKIVAPAHTNARGSWEGSRNARGVPRGVQKSQGVIYNTGYFVH